MKGKRASKRGKGEWGRKSSRGESLIGERGQSAYRSSTCSKGPGTSLFLQKQHLLPTWLRKIDMPYAMKAKSQQFSRRKSNLLKKADQLAQLCHADLALIIRKHGRYYTYRSMDHSAWPPALSQIVCIVKTFNSILLIRRRKSHTLYLSAYCLKTSTK